MGLMIGVGRGANSAGEEVQAAEAETSTHPVNFVLLGQPGSRTHQHSIFDLMDLPIIGISIASRRGGQSASRRRNPLFPSITSMMVPT